MYSKPAADAAFSSVLPVTAFASGLVPGDDITAALRAATAAVRVSTVYGGEAGATIWVPPGAWKISGTILVDVPVSIRGSLERASSLRLADGVSGDLLQIAVGVTGFELSDIFLDGNRANQTATSHGVNFLANTADSNYKGAGELNDVNIRNFRDDGIRAGRLRSNGRLSNVTSGSNGGNGLYFEGYDWIIGDRCDFGENGLASIRAHGDNVQASNVALYGNKNNLYIDIDCGRSTWNNLVCESSTEDLIAINSKMQSRTHSLHGSFGNVGSVPTNNSIYSAFKIVSAAQITILGHFHDATGDATPCLPKYIVDNIASGCLVDVGGFNWKTNAYTDSFASNGVNNITGIQTRIVIPASMLLSVSAVAKGSAAIATIWPVASMPASQNTRLAVNIGHLPRRWKTIDLYVRSMKIGSSAGSVALRPLTSQRANGDDLSAGSTMLGIQVVPVAVQPVRKDTLVASKVVVDSTKKQLVAIDRRAATPSDGDTLAEAYGIEALEVCWRD